MKNHNILTKKEIHFLKSLKSTHGRKKEGAFLVEGVKNVTELLLSGMAVDFVVMSISLSVDQQSYFKKVCAEKSIEMRVLRHQDYNKISTMKNPEGILAVCKYPDRKNMDDLTLPALYLSEVNDPGNLGTIFRTAAWFGIKTILLSENSVDAYNPKALRGSMGSFMHLNIISQVSIEHLVKIAKSGKIPIYAADLKGENPVTVTRKSRDYILAFGSESHGLPEELVSKADKLLSIPKFGRGESLNLAISVGIILNSLINRGEG